MKNSESQINQQIASLTNELKSKENIINNNNLSIKEIQEQIDNVRQKHIEGKSTEIEVCKNCSFKDVYDWVK